MGIGCYAGCGGDVVGQCQGHARRCGRFYCLAHGLDRLCEDCAADLIRDNEAEQRYGAYHDASRNIVSARRSKESWRRATVVAAVLLTAALAVPLTGVLGSAVPLGARGLVVAALAAAAVGSVLRAKGARSSEEDLRRRYGGEPGFQEFLPTWERQLGERTGDVRDVLRDKERLVDLISSALRHRAPPEAPPDLELEPE